MESGKFGNLGILGNLDAPETRRMGRRMGTPGRGLIVAAAAGLAAAFMAARVARRRRGISFAGRVIVITGGSRGLGLVLARQFAAEGARVVLLARDQAELDRA